MGFTRNITLDRAVLGRLLDRLGLSTSLISLLLAHARAVQAAADRLGLISGADIPNVARRHTADSLLFALARPPKRGERWVDIGSGAGFPGLVLACCYPQAAFTLVEPLQKRSGFLELTAGDLGLGNVAVLARRLEDLEGQEFDVAVARALTKPGEAIRKAVRSVRPGGEALIAIGSSDQVVPGASLVEVVVPDDVDSPGLFSMMAREG